MINMHLIVSIIYRITGDFCLTKVSHYTIYEHTFQQASFWNICILSNNGGFLSHKSFPLYDIWTYFSAGIVLKCMYTMYICVYTIYILYIYVCILYMYGTYWLCETGCLAWRSLSTHTKSDIISLAEAIWVTGISVPLKQTLMMIHFSLVLEISN